jgi:hypothetical protein
MGKTGEFVVLGLGNYKEYLFVGIGIDGQCQTFSSLERPLSAKSGRSYLAGLYLLYVI